jgi:predicted nucleic-acid-binding protein
MTVWVLDAVYNRTHGQLVAALELLLTHAQLTLQDEDAVSAALAQYRAHTALGFSDCLVLEVARKAGHVPLGTFDRRLAKLAGAQRVCHRGETSPR